MKRTYKDEGIVLRRQNIGEADRILTVLTKRHGKIKAVVKSVRKINSKKAAHLDLLTHSQIFFAHGRQIDIICETQEIEVFTGLKTSFPKMKAGLYLAEVIDTLTVEGEDHAEVFDFMLQALRSIARLDEGKIPLILLSFEIKLLSALGFWAKNRLKMEKEEVLLAADVLKKRPLEDVFHLALEKGLEKELGGQLQTIIEEISERRLKTPRIS